MCILFTSLATFSGCVVLTQASIKPRCQAKVIRFMILIKVGCGNRRNRTSNESQQVHPEVKMSNWWTILNYTSIPSSIHESLFFLVSWCPPEIKTKKRLLLNPHRASSHVEEQPRRPCQKKTRTRMPKRNPPTSMTHQLYHSPSYFGASSFPQVDHVKSYFIATKKAFRCDLSFSLMLLVCL